MRPVSSLQAQQRVLGERAVELEVRARLARVRAADGHARAHARVATDRRLDRAAARRRATLHEREVFALDLATRERLLQRRVRLLGARDDEQPGGVAVEAVDDAGALGVAAGGAVREQLRERVLAMALGGMHDDAGRLVDDEQVLVLVGDAKGLAGGAAAPGSRRRRSCSRAMSRVVDHEEQDGDAERDATCRRG